MPSLPSIHIDTALTNVSLAYINQTYVADDVMPPLKVEKRSDKYFVYDREAFLRSSGLDAKGRPKSLRAPKTEAAEIDYTMSTQPYFCEEYSRRHLVSDAERRIADTPLDPDIDATVQLTSTLKLDNEVAVAGVSCTSTNYPAANKVLLTTGANGTSWAQYASANSKPLVDIRNAKVAIKKALMNEANTAVYTVDVAQTLADHPDVKDLVKYTHMDALTTSGLPRVLRGLTTVEAATQYATNAEGAAFTSGNIWANENGLNIALVYYRTNDSGPRSIHFGRTFEAPDDSTGAPGFVVTRYRWDPKKGWYIEVAMTRDWRLMAIDGNSKAIGGYLISGADL